MPKHMLPLRNLRLKDATSGEVQKRVASLLTRGYSVQTVKHVRSTVSAIFTHAKQLGWHSVDNLAALVRLSEMVRKQSHALGFAQACATLAVRRSPFLGNLGRDTYRSCRTAKSRLMAG
jgi:hypothetical protein